VLAFIEGFVREHNWATRYDVIERFSDRGIDVRVRRTPPVQPPEREPFYQRPGLKLLVFGVYRWRDNQRFEVALDFPEGNETSAISLSQLLNQAKLSLEAENRRQPLARCR
jgi:hypothetical protein